MTPLRLASLLLVLVGCARSTVGPEEQYLDPILGAPDAGGAPLPPLPDASLLPDASVQPDASAPTVDAGPGAPRDAAPPPPPDVRDAGRADTPDSSMPGPGAVDAGTPPTGTPTTASLTVRTVDVGGVMRSYLLYVPAGLYAGQPVPLVSVHHPYGQKGQYMADITSWRAIADREKVMVSFPNGITNDPWNVGASVCAWGTVGGAPATQDDFGFVGEMIADAATVQTVNVTRVFVAGLSMGGYFAHNLGCKARSLVRAIAANSAGTYAGDCPGDPLPVLIIHGDADNLIPLACAREALGYWVTRNGCGTATTSEAVKEGQCLWNTGCPAGGELGLCTMKGMGHGWAGAPVTGGWLELQYGGGAQFENAAEMMWKFFKKYL